jgi:hypothetical protein
MVSIDARQAHSATLFPILYSPHGYAEMFGKFRLAHPYLPGNAPYVIQPGAK